MSDCRSRRLKKQKTNPGRGKRPLLTTEQYTFSCARCCSPIFCSKSARLSARGALKRRPAFRCGWRKDGPPCRLSAVWSGRLSVWVCREQYERRPRLRLAWRGGAWRVQLDQTSRGVSQRAATIRIHIRKWQGAGGPSRQLGMWIGEGGARLSPLSWRWRRPSFAR